MSFGAAWEAHGFRSARLIQLAADPSRPSAGGAPPYVETSDVLCRTGGACARVPPLAFAASPPDLRQDAKLDHPRQTFVRRRRVRSDGNPKIRTPSTGRDAQPCGWVKRGSRSLDVCWTLPRTLSPDSMKLPSSGMEPPSLATALPLGLPLGSPWRCAKDASRRLLQLTSRNEHPYRSPDFRASRLAPRRPVSANKATRRAEAHLCLRSDRRRTALRQSDPG